MSTSTIRVIKIDANGATVSSIDRTWPASAWHAACAAEASAWLGPHRPSCPGIAQPTDKDDESESPFPIYTFACACCEGDKRVVVTQLS